MLVLQAEQVSVEMGARLVFENAAIEVHQGERIALVGRNGAGKTTLLKVLLGQQPVSKGIVRRHIVKEEIGFMDQSSLAEGVTAREFVEREKQALFRLKRQLREAERLMADGAADEALLSSYASDLAQYMEEGGYGWEAAVERQLQQIGLSPEVWSVPFQSLSGGQKTRVKLAAVMLHQPKLLLLDEPTNHMDSETMDWLANWLCGFRGAVLFVSHDRAFIDRVAGIVFELSPGGTKRYDGGYSDYRRQKEHERKTQEAAYEKREQERKKLQEVVSGYKQWLDKAQRNASERDPVAKKKAARHAKQIKSKEKALERLEQSRVPKPEEGARLKLQLEGGAFWTKTMAALSRVHFSYEGGRELFHNISFQVERGDRLAVVGPNGTGKTTLLKLITGHLRPTAGDVAAHPHMRVGYFMQEVESLQPDETILEQVLGLADMKESDARTILACFLFRGDAVFKRIRNLSMGEKCRVAFVKLYFSHANLLVLDEPTNYLDIETRETIEEALSVYPGAVVLVSHDPYLLRKTANKVISLTGGRFFYYPGTYAEWEGHEQLSDELQALQNEHSRLALHFTNQLSAEVPADEEAQRTHLQELALLKVRLSALETEIERKRRL
ncbi:ribosomal protection-like ABC-F family protein [Ectobacillus ponti]|uniref:ABC-F type ribosomal protection protein n=1 Tax=Ectobacillus ponti TaxID=2961894 RepID=A0AA41X5N1_9BACI|nr:ABC-F type ribosomal protection protein [Ectobacillus ponti]MCP8969212.1 ABC-F type ribosomal protection protein [Ectobacillus ponti]